MTELEYGETMCGRYYIPEEDSVLIGWIEEIEAENEADDFALESVRQLLKSARKKGVGIRDLLEQVNFKS